MLRTERLTPSQAARSKKQEGRIIRTTPNLIRIGLPLLLFLVPATVQAQFDYTTNNGTITITAYTGPGGQVTIPSSITGRPVTSLGDYAFYRAIVTSVTFPGRVT